MVLAVAIAVVTALQVKVKRILLKYRITETQVVDSAELKLLLNTDHILYFSDIL